MRVLVEVYGPRILRRRRFSRPLRTAVGSKDNPVWGSRKMCTPLSLLPWSSLFLLCIRTSTRRPRGLTCACTPTSFNRASKSTKNRIDIEPQICRGWMNTPSMTLLSFCCPYRYEQLRFQRIPFVRGAVEAATSLLRFFFPGTLRSSASVSDLATIFRFDSPRGSCLLAGTGTKVVD